MINCHFNRLGFRILNVPPQAVLVFSFSDARGGFFYPISNTFLIYSITNKRIKFN